MRRLWHGEMILGHDGPAGRYTYLSQDPSFDEDIPIMLVALGPRHARVRRPRRRRCRAAHVLHRRDARPGCVESVRRGAEQAGRDPASSPRVVGARNGRRPHRRELRLRKLVGRFATYLQGYGDLLVSVNGWDPAVLARFRAGRDGRVVPGRVRRGADTRDSSSTCRRSSRPSGWRRRRRVPRRSAPARVTDQFTAGADGVILHGATPTELEPVLTAYREIRPPGRFDGLPANPGRAPHSP